ncbi:major facilitator superfamily domain-containing protein [Dactylonectria estremocensis]|uniref:Major facilitator superfamily domain-containing protein n=1 Tax=Dactylonectria estremocensis TaxID=1079267 RepID=A0A9P9J8U7_9HYPO|nr:major facilitator superfamily domain-containing protein [Dactylonectria estremocensis]
MSDSASSLQDDGGFPDRGPAVFAVTAATLVLATVFVAGRIFCRTFIVRNVTWDDRVMMLAWLFAFFLSFTICFGVRNGLGRHDDNISEDHRPALRRCEYVFSILYNPALMATKTSILIFYLRLAKNTQRVLRFASWLTLAIVNAAGIILTFMNVFQCHPTRAAWDATYDDTAKCIPLLTEFICSSPVNIVTDLAILALPIPVLTGMRLPPRQKTILVLTFTVGIFVAVVDVVRIYYLQQAITDTPTGSVSGSQSRFGGQADFAWNASLSLMWSAVEVNVGMTCACVPTLKPLVLKLLPSMLYDPNGTRSSSSKGPNDSDTPSTGNRASIQPPPAVAFPGVQSPLGDSSAPISAMEFLTTPFMEHPGATSRPRGPPVNTDTTLTSSTGSEGEGIYFGFVNMHRPKSMLKCNSRESFKYCTIVSILFVLWGVSYGLLNTLNNVIASVNNMTKAETLGMTSVYFGGGYFFGPLLVGEWILRRDEHNRSRRHKRGGNDSVGGFKVTFIVGLCFYGVGTVIFWPSAVMKSYGGFMLSNFVVGFGLSILEVGANAFLVLCGPAEYGETRLLLAQGLQGVGSVLSGLMAQKVFFKGITNVETTTSMTLINVQWTYLGITLLCVILALFFYYMPLPEVNDSELEESAKRLPINPEKKSNGLQLRTWSLILAIMAQYTYVAAQESCSINFRSLMISILPSQASTGEDAASGTSESADPDKPPGIALSITDYLLIAHTAFAISRFLAAGFTYFSVGRRRLPTPRKVLTVCIIMCFILALLPVVLTPPNPNLLVVPIVLFFFFEGPIWPLIFAIGLRGQGRRTKRAAAFITMGASGPAFFPFVMYGIIINGGTVKIAFVVVIALHVLTLGYPIFLEFVTDAKTLVDPSPVLRDAPANDELSPMEAIIAQRRRHQSATKEKNEGFFGKVTKGVGAKLMGSRRRSSQPSIQHNENNPGGSPRI